jgi:hypothetical protein
MKSREGQYPAPEALSELLYHWMKVWPDAKLDRAVVASLYPYIVEKWREGWSLLQIAQTACSCDDGRNIKASPAAIKKLPARRMTLPPVEAKPGSPFGGDEIRDVETVAKLKQKIEGVGYEVESIGSLLKAAYLAVKTAPPATRDRAERNVQQLLAKQEAKRKIVEEAQKRLADMEAGRRPPKTERKAKAAAPVASAAQPEKKTRAPRTAKPKAAPSAPPAPPAAGPRSDDAVEDELTAMFAEDDKQ